MNDQTVTPQITLRPFDSKDLVPAQQLSLALLWPHRLEDWQFVYEQGHGFVLEGEGDPVPELLGTALFWRYGKSHASLGMVIVSGAMQGQGLGRRLMSRVLEEIGDRSVQLNATIAGEPLYRKLGFTPTGKVHQHQSAALKPAFIPLTPGERIRPIGANDKPKLTALDALAFGADRSPTIESLLAVSDGVAIDHGGEIIGFALVRRFGHGRVIGPVVAPDIERAKAMISHWAGMYTGSFIRIDVPADTELSPWLSEIGLIQVDTVVSMVKGTAPRPAPKARIFGLVNQALG